MIFKGIFFEKSYKIQFHIFNCEKNKIKFETYITTCEKIKILKNIFYCRNLMKFDK